MGLKDLATAAGLAAEDQDLLELLLREEGVELAADAGLVRRGATRAPLSFAQERLWFLDRLTPGTATYNMPGPLRLRGALDLQALRAAVAELARRHESLRTRFAHEDGEPVQLIDPPGAATLPEVELSALPEPARTREAERLAAAEAAWPFDLARGPLWRSILLRSGDAEHVLLLTLHHIVTDGWSMGVLF
ncbi:MAG TPA: condensation domain-containing protein, partial [Thermoanaerobaculia bacterium]